MLNKLINFISEERSRFENKHNNMFAFCFGEVSRYYEYLLVIHERYRLESKEFMEITKAHQALIKPGTHPVTDDMMALFNKSTAISTKLHLDIESFYLFAKILLDKLAMAIEFYFGQGRGLSLASHDKLVKNFEQFSAIKSLVLDQELLTTSKKLKKDISDFRDYQITHVSYDRNARLTRGTLWDSEGNTKLLLNAIYPTENDRQVETRLLNELITDIEDYIVKIVSFVQQNQSKTTLELDRPNQK